MRRHETPQAVATALARHAPRDAARIIDPAVGNGVLLEPFFRNLRQNSAEIFAIDTDPSALVRVAEKFGGDSRHKLRIIEADFLVWSQRYVQDGLAEPFDCVVVNPPFAARSETWVPLRQVPGFGTAPSVPFSGPIEAAFLLSSISLLRPGGRLLAILPASVIASPKLGWLREILNAHGAILQVHELPRYTFLGIECRIYLLIFEKGTRREKMVLLNHDLRKPERMNIAIERRSTHVRVDYAFHYSSHLLCILKSDKRLGWESLGNLAAVRRGTEKTPTKHQTFIHTNNFKDGFWSPNCCNSLDRSLGAEVSIRDGDILVKRVSRDCARSFGFAKDADGFKCSECVLIIRRHPAVCSVRLLFAIRCFVSLEFAAPLLENGTGASYLRKDELEHMDVPYGLSKRFPREFRRYKNAILDGCFSAMLDIESTVSGVLMETVR